MFIIPHFVRIFNIQRSSSGFHLNSQDSLARIFYLMRTDLKNLIRYPKVNVFFLKVFFPLDYYNFYTRILFINLSNIHKISHLNKMKWFLSSVHRKRF